MATQESHVDFTSQQLEWLYNKTIEGEYNHQWWVANPELCEENIAIVGSVEHNKEWAKYYQMINKILIKGKR